MLNMVRRLINLKRKPRRQIENDSDFHDCVKNIFRNKGYRLSRNGEVMKSDELVLQNDREKIYVQLMPNYDKVNNESMKEMVISMWNFGAQKGYIVVNDEQRCVEEGAVSSSGVEVWDRNALVHRI